MRKAWQRIFLLCVACMICMCGLCFAGNEKWMNYNYYGTPVYSFYVDANSITTCEYEGRKYLDIILKCEKHNGPVTIYHDLFDVENQTMCVLEAKNEAKEGWSDYDYSKIIRIPYPVSNYEYLEKLLTWVEQNRPDVINEIRTFNQSAPQPSPELPGAPNDRRSSGDLRSLIYVPRQSQTATLAFSQYDWEGLAEVYRNPYKDGGEYVIINTYIAEDGKTCFSPYRNGFDYIPDDPDDPGAGGEFLFTGGYMREDELDRYYMRARVEGETIKVEWLIGDRQSGPQRREKDVLYPEDTYGLQPVTDAILDKGFFSIKNMSYRFVSNRGIYKDDRCVLNDDYAPAITTMFAFLDFLNEGNTLDSIVEPPPGITLPSYGRLKQPELYRKPTLTF